MSVVLHVIYPTRSYEALMNTLRYLPVEFRPVYFSFSDRLQSKENRIDNELKFEDFFERSKRISTCLLGEKIDFELDSTSFRDCARKPTHGDLSVYIKRGFKHSAKLFDLMHELMSVPGVSFGYMCTFDEWKHRNYLEKKWQNPKNHGGASSISFVVGADFREYVPGLYWYTVFEDNYLKERGVLHSEIAAIGPEYDQRLLGDGRKFHCYKFFEKPQSWQSSAEPLDGFCCNHRQFFSMLRVQEAVDAAESDSELAEALSIYRM